MDRSRESVDYASIASRSKRGFVAERMKGAHYSYLLQRAGTIMFSMALVDSVNRPNREIDSRLEKAS